MVIVNLYLELTLPQAKFQESSCRVFPPLIVLTKLMAHLHIWCKVSAEVVAICVEAFTVVAAALVASNSCQETACSHEDRVSRALQLHLEQ
jgi:hypothetical protein